jgi:hypothetical protein
MKMKKEKEITYKVVFLNGNHKVLDIQEIKALNVDELEEKANQIAEGWLDYAKTVHWEAFSLVCTGTVTEEDKKINILVSVIPMGSGKMKYTAEISKGKKVLKKIEETTMRKLLIQIREVSIEERWKDSDLHISGNFYTDELDEDDKLAWETSIWEL